MPQISTLVGCLTGSVTGNFELLPAQTRSFSRFGGWHDSNGDSSEKSTRLQSWIDKLKRARTKSSRFCRCAAVSLVCPRSFSGFSCRYCRKYWCTANLETGRCFLVSFRASFLVVWCRFSADFVTTIFATRLTAVFLPLPLRFSSVSPQRSRAIAHLRVLAPSSAAWQPGRGSGRRLPCPQNGSASIRHVSHLG